MFLRREQKGDEMSKIDPTIARLYVLALKHGMKLQDIPRAWLNVERATKRLNPDYKMKKTPRYVKMIMEYGIRKG